MAVAKTAPKDELGGQSTVEEAISGAIVPAKGDGVADLVAKLLGDGAYARPDPVSVAKAIMGESTIDGGDPADAGKAIVARLLMSESIDEMLTTSAAVSAEMMLNATIEVHGVRWQPSGYQDGPQVYALIDCTDVITGERRLVTCGGQNVMAQLLRIEVGEAFPIRVKLVQAAKATAAGNYPLWLEKGDPAPAQESMPY